MASVIRAATFTADELPSRLRAFDHKGVLVTVPHPGLEPGLDTLSTYFLYQIGTVRLVAAVVSITRCVLEAGQPYQSTAPLLPHVDHRTSEEIRTPYNLRS